MTTLAAQTRTVGGEGAPGRGIVKFHAPEVVFGEGALGEAGHAARRLGAVRPFVVTDPGLVAAGWVHELLGHLDDVGLAPEVFTGITPNPKDVEVRAAFERYREQECDVIIGIGGGSAMDAAKCVAILSTHGGDILDYAGLDRATRPIPPMLMIPSTSGSGADVSQSCVVTDTRRRVKVTILGRTVVPEISVTDPRLLTTMDDDLNAATGLDALSHAVEAYVSLGRNPLSDTYALSAVSLIVGNLRRTMDEPGDMAARARMAQASLQAGMAFSNTILGATHALSHQVGGLLDAPHGVVNGILLPHVIRFNAQVERERMADLAAAAGRVPGGRPAEAAEWLAACVRELADAVGVPRGLSDLGVVAGDLARLAHTSLDDVNLTTNPRAVSEQAAHDLFLAAL
ncbi:iron-containing alcohol dehydrogenase [Salana multivorans]